MDPYVQWLHGGEPRNLFQLCRDVRVIYRPLVRLGVSLLLPLRPAIQQVERSALAVSVKALLEQEQIRRSFS